jgi:hypothetical protein
MCRDVLGKVGPSTRVSHSAPADVELLQEGRFLKFPCELWKWLSQATVDPERGLFQILFHVG